MDIESIHSGNSEALLSIATLDICETPHPATGEAGSYYALPHELREAGIDAHERVRDWCNANVLEECFGTHLAPPVCPDDTYTQQLFDHGIEQLNQRSVIENAEFVTAQTTCEPAPIACFEYDPDRPLSFSDVYKTIEDEFTPYILALKNTKILAAGDYIVSGHHNHSTGKQQAKYRTGSWEYQPTRNMTRLEVVKTALVSNCIPVEDVIPRPKDGKGIYGCSLRC